MDNTLFLFLGWLYFTVVEVLLLISDNVYCKLGSYRIVYNIFSSKLVIEIVRMAHCKDDYR